MKQKKSKEVMGRYVRLWLSAPAHRLVLQLQDKTGWSLTKCVLVVLTEVENMKEKQDKLLSQIVNKY